MNVQQRQTLANAQAVLQMFADAHSSVKSVDAGVLAAQLDRFIYLYQPSAEERTEERLRDGIRRMATPKVVSQPVEAPVDPKKPVKISVTEYRVGRNFIRVGDVVKVTPSKPKKRDGFIARVTNIKEYHGRPGVPVEVEVRALDKSVTNGDRTLRPERIQRVAQTKYQSPKEA